MAEEHSRQRELQCKSPAKIRLVHWESSKKAVVAGVEHMREINRR